MVRTFIGSHIQWIKAQAGFYKQTMAVIWLTIYFNLCSLLIVYFSRMSEDSSWLETVPKLIEAAYYIYSEYSK